MNIKKYSISSAFLKNVAYFSMLTDHFFAVVFLAYLQWRMAEGYSTVAENKAYRIGRAVGRIAFILFAFMAAEGFRYTHSRKKYLLRLGIFALCSEIPFDLAFYGKLYDTNGQNVYFTLFLGVAALCLLKSLKGHFILQAIGITLCCITAAFLRTDYMFMGVLLIVTFYIYRRFFWLQCLMGSAVIYAGIVLVNMVRNFGKGITLDVFLQSGMSELYGLFAFVLIYFYNGKKGRQLPKMCYYLFYPLHLLALYGIKCCLFG